MKKVILGVLIGVGAVAAGLASMLSGKLESDQRVMFLPGLATEQPDGFFSVNVDAWVFEREKSRLAVFGLLSWMEVDQDDFSPEQKALFDERTWYFRTDSERAKRLRVRMADQIFNLPRTNAPGRTHGAFRVEPKWIQWQNGSDGSGWIEWTLEAPNHQLHGQKGRAWVIPAKGVSIVSDIDDTIKISNVLDRKTLVRNTFLEPFKAVPGMSEWYQHMARTEQNVFFHYLSASPVQLHPALSGFIEEANFPPGMLHLRESTSWRTLVGSKNDTVKHKKDILTHLLTTCPQRQFILVGDSGEHDPEIYADIARNHPEQIIAIHIRDVTDEDRTAPRYQQTFSGIDPQIWHIRE